MAHVPRASSPLAHAARHHPLSHENKKHTTHRVLAHVLGDLQDEADLVALHLQGRVDGGQLALLELDVDDGADDLSLERERGRRGRGTARGRHERGEWGGEGAAGGQGARAHPSASLANLRVTRRPRRLSTPGKRAQGHPRSPNQVGKAREQGDPGARPPPTLFGPEKLRVATVWARAQKIILAAAPQVLAGGQSTPCPARDRARHGTSVGRAARARHQGRQAQRRA